MSEVSVKLRIAAFENRTPTASTFPHCTAENTSSIHDDQEQDRSAVFDTRRAPYTPDQPRKLFSSATSPFAEQLASNQFGSFTAPPSLPNSPKDLRSSPLAEGFASETERLSEDREFETRPLVLARSLRRIASQLAEEPSLSRHPSPSLSAAGDIEANKPPKAPRLRPPILTPRSSAPVLLSTAAFDPTPSKLSSRLQIPSLVRLKRNELDQGRRQRVGDAEARANRYKPQSRLAEVSTAESSTEEEIDSSGSAESLLNKDLEDLTSDLLVQRDLERSLLVPRPLNFYTRVSSKLEAQDQVPSPCVTPRITRPAVQHSIRPSEIASSENMDHLRPVSALMSNHRSAAMRLAKDQEAATHTRCERAGADAPPYAFDELIGKGSFGRVYKW